MLSYFFSPLFKLFSKHKRKITSAVLALVLIGVLAPNIQPAFAGWECVLFPAACAARTVTTAVTNRGRTAAREAAETVTKGLIGILLIIPLFFSGLFALTTKILLEWALNADVYYITSTAVTLGWPIVRDFANMLVILALIIISVATIIRYKDYEAKKLLPTLIIAAILINFSLVICAVFIDGSNIVMKAFTDSGGNGVINNIDSKVTTGIENAWNGVSDTEQGILTFSMKTIGEIFFNTMSGLVELLYFFLFAFRIFALWMLLILSPLAFACFILPSTRKVFDMWWTQFLNWCIIGMTGGFFYMIANRLQSQMPVANPSPGPAGSLTAGLVDLYGFMVPGALMVIGFLFALQTSAMGSGLAIGAFKKTVGAIRTGTTATGKYVGGYVANKSGASRRYDQVKNKLTDWTVGGLEKVGAVRPGTAASMQAARTKTLIDKETTERIGSLTKKERKALIESRPYSKQSRMEKAAAVKVATEKGELKELSEAEQEQAMRHGKEYGMSYSDFAKTNPVLAARLDEKGKQDLVDRGVATGATDAERQANAETILRKKYYKQYEADVPTNDSDKVDKVRERLIDPATGNVRRDSSGEVVVDAETAKVIDEMAKDGTLGKLKDVLGGLDELADVIGKTTEDFGSSARKALVKLDPRKAADDQEALLQELKDSGVITNPSATVADIAAARTANPTGVAAGERELVKKANGAIAPREINDLDNDALDIEFIKDTTVNKLKKADNLSRAKILKLKGFVSQLRADATAAGLAGNTALETELNEKARVIEDEIN